VSYPAGLELFVNFLFCINIFNGLGLEGDGNEKSLFSIVVSSFTTYK
jgi:hypothetical protein